LIKVTLDPLPAVFDPEAALAETAPLVHDDEAGNLLAEVRIEKGKGASGLDESDVVVEASFEVARQEHAFLETEAGWAWIDKAGRLVLVASTQAPHRDKTEIAPALGFEPERIRIVTPYLGGGFGGKDGINVQGLLALAALEANGRPVKMWWDRKESLLAGVKRLPGRLDYRLGAMSDGALEALDCRILLDAGAYDHLAGEILAMGSEHAGGAYRIPHVRIHGRCAYTNNPPGGPFRGFGVPQVTAAMEQVMDIMAAELKMDPVALRMKNTLHRGDMNPVGVTLTRSTGVTACLQRLAEHPSWREREAWVASAGPFKRRGVGVACLWQGSGYGPKVPDCANAKIELTTDGRFRVDVAVPDMGQGNAATYLQIAGDILNQEADDLDPVPADTDQTLPSGSSTGSRTTYTYANALIVAAEGLKKRILERASALAKAGPAESFVLTPGRVRHLTSGRETPLTDLARSMDPRERVGIASWCAPEARDKIKAELRSAVGLPHILFSYAAHLAMVEVDELTGRIEVPRYVAVTDSGRIINHQLHEQQVQGGIVQGLGYALFEDYQVENGIGLTADLAAYIIPTSLDAPDMESIPVEVHEATGPYGLKGVGEISINGPLPVVANGLAAACGVRIVRTPLTPERVLAVLASTES
jgi:CO/xanthine dehydrogenase Mo-binding subunit